MKIVDMFEDGTGGTSYTIAINETEYVDVQLCMSGIVYVLDGIYGNGVYSLNDDGHRSLGEYEERIIISYVKEVAENENSIG